MVVQEDLRRQILCRAAESVRQLASTKIRLRETEIAKRDVARGVKEDVLGLQITVEEDRGQREFRVIDDARYNKQRNSPVHDIVLVQMLKREHQFRDVESCPLLRKLCFPLEMIEELSTALEICHQVQMALALEREFEADEEGALERALQNLALADRMCHFLLCDDLLLREDLHRVDSLRVLFPHLEDLAKCAAADKLQEVKVARVQVALVLWKYCEWRWDVSSSERQGVKRNKR